MNLKNYFKKARKEKWAIGQFNFSTLEQLKAIFAAAQKMKSPVILGTSESESSYLGMKEVIALTEILNLKYKIPFSLNLDHGKDLKLIKKAIDFGYSAVHFDGSDLPLEKNIKYAKKIVECARKKDVFVESEMEEIGGGKLTSCEKAGYFLKETGADSLAVTIGNVHGIGRKVNLDFKLLKEIREKTETFLVLHGGSGISATQIKKAVKFGIVKININTELRILWKNTLALCLKGKELKPYKILPEVQKRIQKKVEEKIKLFGSVNKI